MSPFNGNNLLWCRSKVTISITTRLEYCDVNRKAYQKRRVDIIFQQLKAAYVGRFPKSNHFSENSCKIKKGTQGLSKLSSFRPTCSYLYHVIKKTDQQKIKKTTRESAMIIVKWPRKGWVPAVSIDGLNLPQSNPQPQRDHVPRNNRRPKKRRNPQD